MKIAFFVDIFDSSIINGVAVSVERAVRRLADRGHKIYIITPDGKNVIKLIHKNIITLKVPSIPAFFHHELKLTNFLEKKTFDFLKSEKIDIIHFGGPSLLGLEAILIAKKLSVPLMGDFNTFIADEEYLELVKLNFWIIKNLAWKYLGLFFNGCDLVTCPSESALKKMLKHGIRGKRNIVLSNGIESEVFDNSKSASLKKKYNPNGKLILSIGRISGEKNVLYMIDIFKKIVDNVKNVKMLLVGDGPQMEEVKNKIKKLGLREKIFILGKIEHEKLIKSGIFGACDIFITTSLTETQGITALESQVNGLVCVGADATGTKDLIKNNYNGFLVKNGDKKDFAEKVIMLLRDDKLYKRMKKNTLKEVKKHYMNNVIDKLEKELFSLVKNRKRQSSKITSINIVSLM